VPSTSSRGKLSISYRRADVAGFWTVAAGFAALSAGLVAIAADVPFPSRWAGAAALVLLLPGVVWRPWYSTGVRAWNSGVRRTSTGLRAYVLGITYWSLLVVVGRAGSRLDLDPLPAAAGGWTPVVPAPPSAHGLIAAARRPGNSWMLALAPAAFLLRVLASETADHAPASSTYTLY
jgi:hypothetical protein